VETFHVVNECKTPIYFHWCLVHALAQQYSCFDYCFIIGVAFSNSFTNSDLQLLIETEQDQMRQSFIQYRESQVASFLPRLSVIFEEWVLNNESNQSY